MSSQLGASPFTGRRKTGTRLSDLRELFAEGITVKAIFEPLKTCKANEDAARVKEMMGEKGYDVMGVVGAERKVIMGYVIRADLASGKIGDHVKWISPEILVADSTPVSELLSLLCREKFLLVLNKTQIEGIVTPADLNKPPVRLYLFSLISLLEMHLGFWVRQFYGDDAWQEGISGKRLEIARDLFENRKERNQEIDLFDCLQFCDKRDLLLKSEKLRSKLDIGSKKVGDKVLKHVEQLRNSLAHSQEDLSQGVGWERVFNTMAWMESFLSYSDRLIEELSENKPAS